jgi:hypothetical protein
MGRTKTDSIFKPSSFRDVDLAYLAGLLDGEGSFQIRAHRRKDKKTLYYPRIVIKMMSGQWEHIVIRLGIGNLYSYQGKHRNQSAWYLFRFNDIEVFLNALLPYLHVKRRHAELMLDWIKDGDNTRLPSNYRHLSRKRNLRTSS